MMQDLVLPPRIQWRPPYNMDDPTGSVLYIGNDDGHTDGTPRLCIWRLCAALSDDASDISALVLEYALLPPDGGDAWGVKFDPTETKKQEADQSAATVPAMQFRAVDKPYQGVVWGIQSQGKVTPYLLVYDPPTETLPPVCYQAKRIVRAGSMCWQWECPTGDSTRPWKPVVPKITSTTSSPGGAPKGRSVAYRAIGDRRPVISIRITHADVWKIIQKPATVDVEPAWRSVYQRGVHALVQTLAQAKKYHVQYQDLVDKRAQHIQAMQFCSRSIAAWEPAVQAHWSAQVAWFHAQWNQAVIASADPAEKKTEIPAGAKHLHHFLTQVAAPTWLAGCQVQRIHGKLLELYQTFLAGQDAVQSVEAFEDAHIAFVSRSGDWCQADFKPLCGSKKTGDPVLQIPTTSDIVRYQKHFLDHCLQDWKPAWAAIWLSAQKKRQAEQEAQAYHKHESEHIAKEIACLEPFATPADWAWWQIWDPTHPATPSASSLLPQKASSTVSKQDLKPISLPQHDPLLGSQKPRIYPPMVCFQAGLSIVACVGTGFLAWALAGSLVAAWVLLCKQILQGAFAWGGKVWMLPMLPWYAPAWRTWIPETSPRIRSCLPVPESL